MQINMQAVQFVFNINDFIFDAVFDQVQLKEALLPSLEKLNRQDPESLPFKQPVDPQVS